MNGALNADRLKKLLLDGKFLSSKQLTEAALKSENEKIPLDEAIVDLGYLSDTELGKLVASELGLLFFDVTEKIESDALGLLPERVARGQQTVVYRINDEGLWLASNQVGNYEFFKLVEKRYKQPIHLAYATRFGIKQALDGYQKDPIIQIRELLKRMERNQLDEDVTQLVQLLLTSAFDNHASDIHIEPEDDNVVVRFRIDGNMREMVRYPVELHEKVVFRIKILARLRTDEHAQAQDGRFEIKLHGVDLNLRVSVLPITHGENVVMRLLTERFQRLRLEDLGLQPDDMDKIIHAAEMPYGMIVAAGPTGSGKTTTLYAIINILNKPDVNLMTIEDPVEYNIKGIRQIQVNPRTNLTFEAGLKSIVRQDPDIIMVGEIRDPKTADIAVNAALTGHLLLTSLHANDAAASLPRIFEMDVEPFLIASSVNVVLAQRLVRRVCTHCIESYALSDEEKEAIERDEGMVKLVKDESGQKNLSKVRVYRGAGCTYCSHSGFSGRIGIYEILEVTESLRPLIVEKASSDVFRQAAIKEGMRTMLHDGMQKVFQGMTTLGEVIRATKL
ncbi:MAG: ATPase, T2SS/T4P/T4SS family [Patescibacteria group bacterium]|nr:ATPase, T2SS/T4P/T4SS family [Patescibacteria group bacterium]